MPIWLYKFRVPAAPAPTRPAHPRYTAADHATGSCALARTANCLVSGGSHPSLAVWAGRP